MWIRFASFISAAVLGTCACVELAASQEKIVINQSAQSLSAATVYLANDLGYFRDEGLDVEFMVTGSGLKSIVPLISGDTQFCACVFSHVVNANVTGAGNVKVIGSLVTGYSQKMVLSRAAAERLGITEDSPLHDRIKALKDLKIGISEPNSAADQVARLMLREGGLDPDRDVKLISLGVPNLNAALHNGQIDAFVITAPHPELAVQQGDGIMLIDLSKDKIGPLGEAIYMGLAATADYLETHHDVGVHMIKALARAQTMLQTQPEKAKQILKDKEFPQMDQSTFDIGFKSAFPFYSKTPAVSDASVQAALDLARDFSTAPLDVKNADLVDSTLQSD